MRSIEGKRFVTRPWKVVYMYLVPNKEGFIANERDTDVARKWLPVETRWPLRFLNFFDAVSWRSWFRSEDVWVFRMTRFHNQKRESVLYVVRCTYIHWLLTWPNEWQETINTLGWWPDLNSGKSLLYVCTYSTCTPSICQVARARVWWSPWPDLTWPGPWRFLQSGVPVPQ